jgi:hypothetical protein
LRKSKLIALLKILDRKEWGRLEEFIASPYFNKNEDVLRLFRYLKKTYPHFPAKKMDKEKVFKAVFPKQAFDKKHFNHIQNYLFRLVEQFIAQQQLMDDPFEQDQRILTAFLDARLDKHYIFKRNQLKRILEAETIQDEQFYFQKYRLAKTENEHFILQRQRIIDPAIQESYDALDVFYLIEKLKFLAQMIDRQKQFPQSYNVQEFEYLDRQILQKNILDIPSIKIYRQLVLMLMSEEDVTQFDIFRNYLEEYSDLVQAEELKRLFLFAINYCIRKIAAGLPFQQNLLELYYSGLENGTLLEFGVLSPWTYKNVVQLGLAQGDIGWVERFIEQYAEKLPANFREDAYHYNLAALFYAKKNYEDAMTYLNRVQYSDISYKLWSKELLVKIYFELDAFEALHSLLSSFEQLVKRNKQISKPQREAFRNFIRITGKLMKVQQPTEKLRKSILDTTQLRERKWLLQQVGDSGPK